MKYLVSFEKGEAARWLGHLDVKRAFERAIRRAGLPVAHTEGFNPQPKLAFASALGVGVTASADPAIVELTQPLAADELKDRLNAALPSGLRIGAAETIADAGSRAVLGGFTRAEMAVACERPPGVEAGQVEQAIARLLACPELIVERHRDNRTRRLDARPLIRAVRVAEATEGGLTLAMTLEVRQTGAVRAEEVVALVAKDVPGLAIRRAHRTRLERDVSEPVS